MGVATRGIQIETDVPFFTCESIVIVPFIFSIAALAWDSPMPQPSILVVFFDSKIVVNFS